MHKIPLKMEALVILLSYFEEQKRKRPKPVKRIPSSIKYRKQHEGICYTKI